MTQQQLTARWTKLDRATFTAKAAAMGVQFKGGSRKAAIEQMLKEMDTRDAASVTPVTTRKGKRANTTRATGDAAVSIDQLLAALEHAQDKATKKKLRRQLRTAGHTGGRREIVRAEREAAQADDDAE